MKQEREAKQLCSVCMEDLWASVAWLVRASSYESYSWKLAVLWVSCDPALPANSSLWSLKFYSAKWDIMKCDFFSFANWCSFFGHSSKRGRRDAGGLVQRETNLQTLITLIQLNSAKFHSSLHTHLFLFLWMIMNVCFVMCDTVQICLCTCTW